jgi:hypothetical protein
LSTHSSQCPKYHTCNAPICPLDPGWGSSYHAHGEPACRYLLATGKAGAAEHFAGDPVFPVALRLVGAIGERFPNIATKVAAAARQPIKKPPGRAKTPPPAELPRG